jgi:hypothetical protein
VKSFWAAKSGKDKHKNNREDKMDAQIIREMMDGWNKIMADVRQAMPDATEEEIIAKTTELMNKSLGI